jgi:hypothetical protein
MQGQALSRLSLQYAALLQACSQHTGYTDTSALNE